MDLGLDYAYMAFDVASEGLRAFIDAAKTLNMAGFNLTMPLKRDILPYIDVLDTSAELAGAVNTVALRADKLYGFNTDGEGFMLSLNSVGIDIDVVKAVVLGTGGASVSITNALVRHGADVKVGTRQRNLAVSDDMFCLWDELAYACSDCTLLVNATPLGMHGFANDFTDFSFLDALPGGAAVYDLIYSPRETSLLKNARARGLQAVNGIPLLVMQAALAFRHFTGEMPSEAAINSVMEEIFYV